MLLDDWYSLTANMESCVFFTLVGKDKQGALKLQVSGNFNFIHLIMSGLIELKWLKQYKKEGLGVKVDVFWVINSGAPY